MRALNSRVSIAPATDGNGYDPPLPMARAHLLVVDDEPSILTTLQKALQLEGYSVDVAGAVQVAEDKLKKRSYDLCLFDVMLPDGDGLDLLARMRAAKVETPVIMMSGHATIDTAVKATRLGALNFLEKPINTDALLIGVETALRLDRAEAEAKALRQISGSGTELVGESAAVKRLVDQIQRAAKSAASVLVTGERGTGKELVARAIHQLSPRAKGPLEKLNCAALPSELIESELFGHVKGAFTGAIASRPGKFQAADKGTLFLDEIGELPLNLQVKLLRALQERVVYRVGDAKPEKVDIRVVAATNRVLEEEIRAGRFREDLYYRLNVVNIYLPALRDRADDVLIIAKALLSKYADELGSPVQGFTPQALAAIKKYTWPGNIRQLENRIRKALVLCDRTLLSVDDLDLGANAESPILPLEKAKEEFQRKYVLEVLERNNGNRTQTARDLGVDPRTIFRYLEREANPMPSGATPGAGGSSSPDKP
ncbi:MAG: sigma-54 dependent transcriptional regulator [Polyangiaceae bacterium]